MNTGNLCELSDRKYAIVCKFIADRIVLLLHQKCSHLNFDFLTVIFPKLSGLFQKLHNWSHFDKNATDFFLDVLKQTLDARNETDEVSAVHEQLGLS